MARSDYYLTASQAALELDVSHSTINRWVREGYISAGRSPSPTGRGRTRIPRSEIERIRAQLNPTPLPDRAAS
jgi:excisionase family DNA binding protein